jgi:hypothetical protein
MKLNVNVFSGIFSKFSENGFPTCRGSREFGKQKALVNRSPYWGDFPKRSGFSAFEMPKFAVTDTNIIINDFG